MSQPNVGVLGIGTYLPKQVRKNDWWPEQVVRKWRMLNVIRSKAQTGESDAPGARMILAALAELKDDPFEGITERRVVDDGMAASEMEAEAAKEALARAQIRPDQIEFCFGYSACPDLLGVPTTCATHQRLGLPSKCFTLTTDCVCNGFSVQLMLAQQMIRSGAAKYGLLVQSSSISRVTDPKDPSSAWFGDAATAAVVGPVSDGKGVLSMANRTYGEYNRVLTYGIEGKQWYDEGRVMLYSLDRAGARRMVLNLADWAKDVMDEALASAGATAADVDYYASHQAQRWLRKVTSDLIGFTKARGVDTFPWAGSVLAANIPLQLDVAQREGLLRDGDLVATYAGGVGVTSSAMVLRWGT